jgi:FkbM family methyltransferase
MMNPLKFLTKKLLSMFNLRLSRINPCSISYFDTENFLKEEGANALIEYQLHKAAQIGTHKHLKALITHYNINVILDVGANEGQFAEMVLAMGYHGRIISFEPANNAFNILQKKALIRHNWECHNYGLSDSDSDARLHVYEDDTFSSLYTPSKEGRNLFGTLIDETGQENIKLMSINSIYSALKLNKSDRILLKSDTQGHDYEVIEGCDQCLQQIDVVMTEASFLPIYQSNATALKILSLLASKGFVLSGLYPFSFTPDLKLIELDMFFVRH